MNQSEDAAMKLIAGVAVALKADPKKVAQAIFGDGKSREVTAWLSDMTLEAAKLVTASVSKAIKNAKKK